jgi:hypothetical protein
VGVLGDELAVVADADQWPAVAGEGDDGACAEDGVDGSTFEAEGGEVASAEERFAVLEALGGGRANAHATPAVFVSSLKEVTCDERNHR